MMEAHAQGANPNWSNTEDHNKTPLIMAVESVSKERIVENITGWEPN